MRLGRVLRGTTVGIRGRKQTLWKIFCDLGLEGKYFGNQSEEENIL